MTDNTRETDGTLTSDALAELIIDALVDAEFIKKEAFDKAVEVVKEEIDARKSMDDY